MAWDPLGTGTKLEYLMIGRLQRAVTIPDSG